MLIALACITLMFSAFFSGVEIAFISANKLQLELDKSSGKFPSNIIAYFTKKESDFLATMLIGNNISLVVFGIVMTKILTPIIYPFFSSDYMILLAQTIISTLIILIAAEFIPKVIFRIYPNNLLIFFSLPILLFYVLFRPISLLMLNVSRMCMKILGQNIEETRQVFGILDLDEYLANIQSNNHQEEGRIEVEMLQNALDLSNKKLRECMIPRTEIIALDVQTSIEQIKQKFIDLKLSKILIYKGNIDRIIGYVHSSDLFKNPRNVRSILLPIPIVPETMLVIELLTLFIEQDKGVALVVDEFGGTSGMLTIEDVTEEIVGEIEDEHDIEQLLEKKLNDVEYEFSARLDVEMINKKYHLNLPESEEYETLAGLILNKLEEIPVYSDVIKIDKYTITITKVSDRVIQTIHLKDNFITRTSLW